MHDPVDWGTAMSIKDILVQADLTPASEPRIVLAVQVARRFAARLTGLCVLPPVRLLTPPEDSTVVVEVTADLATLKAQAADDGARFAAMLDREGLQGAWLVEAENAFLQLQHHALISDLVILGQHDPNEPAGFRNPERVILNCGRPVLVVPYAGEFLQVGRNALVAWNGSREATRAAHDALPIMGGSDAVTVISVDEDKATPPGSELADHLRRHGMNAKAEKGIGGERSAADAILSRAADLGCDLIVLGACHRAPLVELILGGVTRDMLKAMTVPVLLAH